MDKAFNKKTNKTIDAIEIFKDGSYQQIKKNEWISPIDSITNWDELEKLGIKEVKVHYVSPKRWIDKNNNKQRFTSSCFAVYPNSPAKTKGGESEEHKKLKNWLFERLAIDDLKLLYSQGTKPHRYKNFIKLSELEIDWSNYQIPEATIKSTNKIRADILLPFKSKDNFFGDGIIFEIQLCGQKEDKIYERTIDRIKKGYSVVWVYPTDFYEDKNGLTINEELKIYPFSVLLNEDGKIFLNELRNTIEKQCRFMDEKKKECNLKIEEVNKTKEIIINKINKEVSILYENHLINISNEHKKYINEFSSSIKKEINDKIKLNFFEDNEEKINQIIEDKVQYWMRRINWELFSNQVKENINSIDFENRAKIIIERSEEQIKNILTTTNLIKDAIENPPNCSKCNEPLKLIPKKNGGVVYHCNLCDEWFNIPNNFQIVLTRGIE